MRKTTQAAAACLLLGLAAAAPPPPDPGFPLSVTTAQGPVVGRHNAAARVDAWRGVPFAAPPVGALRWMPPAPPAPRSAPLVAKTYAPSCQLTGENVSEDCLYLNIWRPDTKATKLPVLVWIHGGSNISGDGSGTWFTAAHAFNAVVVSINYRMGPLGWFLHPALMTGDPQGDSGNFGTLDQIAALAWVQANINSFGGDPHNVTLAGQSAGSQDVSYLMHAPAAQNLFAKAIIESNYPGIRPVAAALKSSKQALYNLLVQDHLAADAAAAKALVATMSNQQIATYLRGQTPAQLAEAYKTPFGTLDWGDFYRTDINAGTTGIAPPLVQNVTNRPEFVYAIGDGTVLPAIPFADFSQGHVFPKPVIMGTTRNENEAWNAYFPFNYRPGVSLARLLNEAVRGTDPAKAPLQNFYNIFGQGSAATFAANYTFATQLIDALDIYLAVVQPALDLASFTNPAIDPVYVYRFEWSTNPRIDYKFPNQDAWKFYLGAVHGSELDFFWQNFAGIGGMRQPGGGAYTHANLPGRKALSHQIGAYLRAFITNPTGQIPAIAGQPAWLPWQSGASRFMVMDADATKARLSLSTTDIPPNVATLYGALGTNTNAAVDDFVSYYVLWSWGMNWYPNAYAGPFSTAPGPNPLFNPAMP